MIVYFIFFLHIRDLKKNLIEFPPCFRREKTFATPCLLSYIANPFWKGVYFKKKEFAPDGSKFFPFRVDPFFVKEYDGLCLTSLSTLFKSYRDGGRGIMYDSLFAKKRRTVINWVTPPAWSKVGSTNHSATQVLLFQKEKDQTILTIVPH